MAGLCFAGHLLLTQNTTRYTSTKLAGMAMAANDNLEQVYGSYGVGARNYVGRREDLQKEKSFRKMRALIE